MPASNPIAPKGGYNHVQFDYFTPQTALGVVRGLDQSGGTEWWNLNNTTKALLLDKINEFTSAAGVTIDSLLVKDGSIRTVNDAYVTARNQANSADVNLLKLNTSDRLVFGTSALTYTNYTPTLTCSGSMTLSSTSILYARYFEMGSLVFVAFQFSGTLGGTADSEVRFTLPFTNIASRTKFMIYDVNTSRRIGIGEVSSNATFAKLFTETLANWSLGSGQEFEGQFFYFKA